MNSNCYFPLPESWQYQSNFRTMSHDNSKTQLHNALNHRSHALSSVSALHDFYFTSAVERTANTNFHKQESPISQLEKL